MAHALDGCRLKLLRAQEHLEALHAEVERFYQRSPYGIVGEVDAKTDRYVFRVCVFEEPPRRLGVYIGDFLHNASSALEHLAWELVRLDGGTPIERQTGFPIFTKREKWDAMAPRMMEGMSQTHRAEIEELQPFRRGTPVAVHFDELALLQHLWNVDKHRTLYTTTTVVTSAGADFVALRDCDVLGEDHVEVGRYEHGAVVAWTTVRPTGPKPKVAMHGRSTVDIAFGDVGMSGPQLADHSVREKLDNILSAVYRVYERFLLDFPT